MNHEIQRYICTYVNFCGINIIKIPGLNWGAISKSSSIYVHGYMWYLVPSLTLLSLRSANAILKEIVLRVYTKNRVSQRIGFWRICHVLISSIWILLIFWQAAVVVAEVVTMTSSSVGGVSAFVIIIILIISGTCNYGTSCDAYN